MINESFGWQKKYSFFGQLEDKNSRKLCRFSSIDKLSRFTVAAKLALILVDSHFIRCGACCFLRGICVLRKCSDIRAVSSSLCLDCN